MIIVKNAKMIKIVKHVNIVIIISMVQNANSVQVIVNHVQINKIVVNVKVIILYRMDFANNVQQGAKFVRIQQNV